MARTSLTVQTPTLAGTTPTFTSADVANGNQFLWPGKSCFIEAKNVGGSPANITIQTPAVVDGLAVADVVVSIPATSGDKIIPLVNASSFVQADGYVYIDAAAAMTIAVITVP
jgi:hypothetical protein